MPPRQELGGSITRMRLFTITIYCYNFLFLKFVTILFIQKDKIIKSRKREKKLKRSYRRGRSMWLGVRKARFHSNRYKMVSDSKAT